MYDVDARQTLKNRFKGETLYFFPLPKPWFVRFRFIIKYGIGAIVITWDQEFRKSCNTVRRAYNGVV